MAEDNKIISLPFRATEFNEDLLVVLNRSFREIEYHLFSLQKYMLSDGYKNIYNSAEFVRKAITHGKESDMPLLNKR